VYLIPVFLARQLASVWAGCLAVVIRLWAAGGGEQAEEVEYPSMDHGKHHRSSLTALCLRMH